MAIAKTQTKNSALIKLIIGLAVTIGICFIPAPSGLTWQAMVVLGLLFGTIYFMQVNICPDYLIGAVALLVIQMTGIGTFAETFSGFSSSTYILLIGAFAIGGVVSKCNVLPIIGNAIVSKFPNTYAGRCAAMYLSGLVMSPCVPSGSAKGVIMALLSTSVAKNMGFKAKTRGGTGLFMAAWVPVGVVGVCFLSGGILGPLLAGLTPEEYLHEFTWVKWCLNSLVFGIVMMIGCYVANLIIYKPKPGDIDESMVYTPEKGAKVQLDRNQILCIVTVVGTIVFWMFSKTLGVSDAVVAILGMTVMAVLGLMDRKAILNTVPWSLMFYIAYTLSLATIIKKVGLTDWIVGIVGDLIIPLMQNLWIFVPVASLTIFLIRIVLISQSLTNTMFYMLFVPVAIEAGLNPWILGFICATSVCSWFIMPQNVSFMSMFGAADGGEYPDFTESIKMSFFVMIWTVVCLLVSIPWWKFLGMV